MPKINPPHTISNWNQWTTFHTHRFILLGHRSIIDAYVFPMLSIFRTFHMGLIKVFNCLCMEHKNQFLNIWMFVLRAKHWKFYCISSPLRTLIDVATTCMDSGGFDPCMKSILAQTLCYPNGSMLAYHEINKYKIWVITIRSEYYFFSQWPRLVSAYLSLSFSILSYSFAMQTRLNFFLK